MFECGGQGCRRAVVLGEGYGVDGLVRIVVSCALRTEGEDLERNYLEEFLARALNLVVRSTLRHSLPHPDGTRGGPPGPPKF